MSARILKNGATSNIEDIMIRDSTTGAGKTGLTFSTSGLIISTMADNEASATAYTQSGSLIETVTTTGTYAAPTATKCRFKEVDATNRPGVYQVMLADARYAVSSAKYLDIDITVSGAIAQPYRILLTAINLQDATAAGISNLDTTVSSRMATYTQPTGFLAATFPSGTVANTTNIAGGTITTVSGNVSGNVVGSVGSVSGSVGGSIAGSVASVTGNVGGSVIGNVGGNVTGSVGSVTARVTANTDQLAGQTVTAAAGVTFPTSIASPTNITAGTITTVTNLTNAPTVGDFTSTMKTSLNAATPSVTISDKTGFSLASNGLSSVTAWTVAITGNITGNLSGSVGSVTGLTASNLDATISSRASATELTKVPKTGQTNTWLNIATSEAATVSIS